MLINIKSSFISKRLFYNLDKKRKLKIVKYNKKLQNKINLDIIDYKSFSGRYIEYETKIKGKEFNIKNNILIYEGGYLNGERNGKGKEYNEEKDLIFEGEYKEGKKIKGKEYYDLNELALKQLLNNKIIDFPKNPDYFSLEKEKSKLLLEKLLMKMELKEKGEEYKGQLKFEGEYLNGERNGKGKEYYSNGKLKFEGEYLNGKREGKGKEYFKDGTIKFEGEYYNGKNGIEKEVNIEKEIKIQIEFLNEFKMENNEFEYSRLSMQKKIFLFEKLYSEEKDLEIKKLLEHYKQVYEVQFNKDRIRKYYESKKEKK